MDIDADIRVNVDVDIHIVILTDAEKAFEKTKYSFLITPLINFLSLIKGFYGKPIGNIILKDERLNDFL